MNTKNKKSIITEYTNEKKSLNYLSKKYGVSSYSIRKTLTNNGVRIRTLAEANDIANRDRALSVNHQYFKKQGKNQSYIIGLLTADGYVSKGRNSIKLTLQRRDRGILDKIREEMEIERTVKDYLAKNSSSCKSFPTSELVFSSREIKKDLYKFGVYNNKTKTISVSKEIEDRFFIDYFRGFFDGDGSASQISPNQFKIRLSCGSKRFLQEMTNSLYSIYGIPKVNVGRSREGAYSLEYSTLSSIKIYNLMYGRDSLYLKRKKERLDFFMKERQEEIID